MVNVCCNEGAAMYSDFTYLRCSVAVRETDSQNDRNFEIFISARHWQTISANCSILISVCSVYTCCTNTSFNFNSLLCVFALRTHTTVNIYIAHFGGAFSEESFFVTVTVE